MPPTRILDTHIHLWPSTATSPTSHRWMTPSHPLAKRHGISDYKAATSSSPASSALKGFIYVETDRYLPSKTPQISVTAAEGEVREGLKEWAKAPLEELRFLKRVVEGRPEEGDGFMSDEGRWLKGAVVWAPFHLPESWFQIYLNIAESVAGPMLWERVVGFRYLLQGKEEGEVTKLVGSDEWVENIVSLSNGRGGKGWVFDVGVDIHRDGPGPMEDVGDMIGRVREREAKNGSGNKPVRFVLNHLCKHPLSPTTPTPPTPSWLTTLSRLSTDQHIFIKLSGALNEFTPTTPSSPSDIVKSLTPIVTKVFQACPGRTMFGSDWPVCNVGGPAGEEGNWGVWVQVVEGLLDGLGCGEVARECVWWGAGCRAYGVEV